jgi:hypothetical protein
MNYRGYDIDLLRKEFSRNKEIPAEYEKEILAALSHYPELKDTKIKFKLTNHHPVPYGTTPSLDSVFKSPSDRRYTISILEKAKEPEESALVCNLPFEARIGVIGHELAHVAQFQSCSRFGLASLLASYAIPFFRKRIEKGADKRTIFHGLGKELLMHAIFIRGIPGYVQQRKELNRNYLKPFEIKKYLK